MIGFVFLWIFPVNPSVYFCFSLVLSVISFSTKSMGTCLCPSSTCTNLSSDFDPWDSIHGFSRKHQVTPEGPSNIKDCG